MTTPGDDVVVRSVEGALEGRPDGARDCRNCGSALTGPWCAACGQKAGDLHVTVGEFVGEALDSLFSFDSRFWRTLGPLLARPGFLTVEYWQGRRSRYLPPLRLYLFVSFLTFLILGLLGAVEVVDLSGDPDADGIVKVRGVDGEAAEIDWDEDLVDAGPIVRWLALKVARPAMEQPERVRGMYLQRLPWAVFLLVPFFGVLLRLLYRKRERYFVPHLVFALHFHSAFFLFLLVGEGVDRVLATDGIASLAVLGGLVYLYLALRRGYGDGRGKTVVKETALVAAHTVALAITLVVLLGLTTAAL